MRRRFSNIEPLVCGFVWVIAHVRGDYHHCVYLFRSRFHRHVDLVRGSLLRLDGVFLGLGVSVQMVVDWKIQRRGVSIVGLLPFTVVVCSPVAPGEFGCDVYSNVLGARAVPAHGRERYIEYFFLATFYFFMTNIF